MTTFDKLIKKVFNNSQISYADAERILFKLGFDVRVRGSHHIFSKKDYPDNIALKKRAILFPIK